MTELEEGQGGVEGLRAAAPAKRTITASRVGSVLDWLIRGTREERYADIIFHDLCERLRATGIPVARATMHLRIQHPQWDGARFLWRAGAAETAVDTFERTGFDEDDAMSPVAEILRGAAVVRADLLRQKPQGCALFDTLAADGLTDYIAWPIEHTLGRRHVVTFASDAPGGFAQSDLDTLADLLPALALVSEIRLKNRLARTLLETYVGPHAGDEILAGAITRGSGRTVAAAIMICDLRDFTSLSGLWPRDDIIGLLNDYFDAMCEPIERHGGEILKFMGDGLLAVFPLERPRACDDLVAAVEEGEAAMEVLNRKLTAEGHEPLRYGIGVHVGDVMYGNIGSRTRLDFTVIGPAVNVAARLEALTKRLKRRVLMSQAFAERLDRAVGVEPVGTFSLRGVLEPLEVLALAGVDHHLPGDASHSTGS